MAWSCHGLTNIHLCENLRKENIISNENVFNAMSKTDRAFYANNPATAHKDCPQYLGHGATISAPHMHAYALELLHDQIMKTNARILDVGSGSGYLLAAFKRMNPNSQVIGIEHIPELAEKSIKNLQKDDNFDQKVKVICGDGRNPNPEISGKFDVIHVGAAPPEIPKFLKDILNENGRMVIPVGTDYQRYLQLDKDEMGQITEEKIMMVQYVPLTSVEHQLSREVD